MEIRVDQHFSLTPLGKRAKKELFLEPLAAHIAANLDPPGGLAEALKQVPPIELAQTALAPMLHGALTNWDGVDLPDLKRNLCHTVGQYLHCLLVHRQLLKEAPNLAKQLQQPRRSRRRPRCNCPACRSDRANGIRYPRKTGRKRQADMRNLWLAEWEPVDFVTAGYWLVDKAVAMPYFTIDTTPRYADGKLIAFMPVITPDWMESVEAIRQELIALDHHQLPSFEPLPDWTALFQDGLCFVTGFHADTRSALKRAFADRQIDYDADATEEALAIEAATRPSTPASIAAEAALELHTSTAKSREIPGVFLREHVAGANALQRVSFRLDPTMVELSEQFAWLIVSADLKPRDLRQRQTVVRQDLQFARSILNDDRPFWMRHRCDWRGRVYQMPYLHYQREDFIRAMFRFASGKKLSRTRAGAWPSHYEGAKVAWDGKHTGSVHPVGGIEVYNDGAVGGYTDLEILEIHCANCHGEDKLTWGGRLDWVKKNRPLIERIAADPFKTFDDWRDPKKVSSPFCFVAACRELARAWNDPDYESCLPVAFDGSANGYQHAALLVRNAETARKVNLIGNERNDLYSLAADELMNILAAEGPKDCFALFERLSPKEQRKLVKSPTMTFGYGAEDRGMVQDISQVFYDLFPKAGKQRSGFFLDLVTKILEAIDRVLPGAFICREYIVDLSGCRLQWGGFPEWISPTGFPVINSYREPDVVPVYGHYAYGGRIMVANGELADKPLIDEAIRSAAPNFVHSMDASHLVRVVLAARDAGIDNLVTVHDSFACLAADAPDLLRIIKRELFMLYYRANWLGRLCERNIPGGTMPPMGDLNTEEEFNGEYPWS